VLHIKADGIHYSVGALDRGHDGFFIENVGPAGFETS
jgi:hypothetical protein